jgi:hypothetical protein
VPVRYGSMGGKRSRRFVIAEQSKRPCDDYLVATAATRSGGALAPAARSGPVVRQPSRGPRPLRCAVRRLSAKRNSLWEESDRSVAKPGRRRAIREKRNSGYPVRRLPQCLASVKPRGLAGSISSTCHAPGVRVAAKAATPLTHGSRAQQVASRREPAQFPIPRVPAYGNSAGCNKDSCFSAAEPATSISLASLFAIASAKELKSSTTSKKALGPPITFCR